ncbi:hypothetical protein [Limnoglobus roseus]|uniref:Uncharacterized protein n=1 Tax=Limnoglobus roseus TaxID=2598579 RepID=A0A5C1ALZ5_9BACT|nr:hypothetical protein [Limnoglobus roseus]QEL20429.1 hypothetical protein PX52LOC_07525 [Limnoglobus roseus]
MPRPIEESSVPDNAPNVGSLPFQQDAAAAAQNPLMSRIEDLMRMQRQLLASVEDMLARIDALEVALRRIQPGDI